MKGLIIYKEGLEDNAEIYKMFFDRLTEAEGKTYLIDTLEGQQINDQKKVLKIVKQEYDFIVLPLTLPHYLSLRLAELVHQLKLKTRLILQSRTEVNATPLFDSQYDLLFPRDLLTESKAEVSRTLDDKAIESAIDYLLSAASCFGKGGTNAHRGTPSTLDDYRASYSVPSLKEAVSEERNQVKNDIARKVKILFLASDPSDASRLRLGQELRDIGEKLQLAKARDSFELEARMSLRPRDISQALLDIEPHVVHFSGHGTSTGELCFETENGNTQTVKPDALANLFRLFAKHVGCVVLNACYSRAQATAIAKHINYVIGMNTAISDQAAMVFAVGFYKALAAGRPIEEAYHFGVTEIQLEGIPEDETPILFKKRTKRGRINANQI